MGDKLFIGDDGEVSGSVGDPLRDKEVSEALRGLVDYGRVKVLVTQDGAQVFLEGYTMPASVIVAGGGHIGKSLAPLVKMMGLRLHVVDDRPEFANKERFPEADSVVVADYAEGLTQLDIRPNSSVVIATRGHREDDRALEAAVRSPAGYVGLVGSRRKTILIYEELLRHGIPLERLQAVHAPVGLDIGAKTPEEIAMSIVAEIVASREGRPGKAMTMEGRYLQRLAQKVGVPV